VVKIEGIDVDSTLKQAKQLIEQEANFSPALKATFNVWMVVVQLLVNRIGLNSRNSSKPPSSDQNRPKDMPDKNTDKKSGGQRGHVGSTLEKIDKLDETLVINIDRKTIPQGHYTDGGFETRQVFDIHICRKVTQYQAQVLLNEKGERFVAPFPDGVSKAA
jgi:transposase